MPRRRARRSRRAAGNPRRTVGVSTSTESLGTGSMRFQIRWIFAPGRPANTCNGPVKSVWVLWKVPGDRFHRAVAGVRRPARRKNHLIWKRIEPVRAIPCWC